MSTPAEEQIVRGTIRRVTFHNPENGYSVIQVGVTDKPDPVTVVGLCPKATVGAHVVVRGTFKEHPRFGKQFSAISITETAPSSALGIRTYLASGIIKGVGQKTAERLVDAFGEKTLEIIYQEPDRAAAVPGVGRHRIATMRAALAEQREIQEIMRFLLEHQIPQGLATKIYERYANRAVEVISKDPYILARDLRGVGFATADAIALKLGFAPDSPQRVKAGLYYALERSSDDGHCFLEVSQLVQRTRMLLGCSEESHLDLETHLNALINEEYLIRHGDCIYLRHLFRAEDFVARFVAQRVLPRDNDAIDALLIERCIKRAAQSLGVSFSPEQEQAVRAISRQRFFIITGGPGCGKTTIIRALATTFREANKRLMLAAPTGRAAQRMAQVCQTNASTIHRLLRYDPMSRRFRFGLQEPLPTDALIIDEASMMDILLSRDLFSAIPKEATLILVGDKDQLPSVGPGRVFADLISSPRIKTIALTQLFRRAEESNITAVAHQINSEIIPQIPEPDGMTKSDAYFLPRKDPIEAAATIEKLVAEQVPKKFDIQPRDIMVLTPSNRGELGALRLNQRLQAHLNPPRDSEQELIVGDTILRLGDRVCQRVNNYQIDDAGVFNGDLGEIYSVDRKSGSLVVELWDGRLVKYDPSELSQLSLAYAVTVHRSQGSEIPCVILALHDSHYTLLDKQLVYTGVTRAKKLLIVVGSKRALMLATKRASARKRNSRLRTFIEECAGSTNSICNNTRAHPEVSGCVLVKRTFSG